jgi:carboxypeptidase Taq
METQLKALARLDQKLASIIYAMSLISFDSLTSAPKNSLEGRASALEGLSTFYYETLINEETKVLLDRLKYQLDELDAANGALVQILIDEYEMIGHIPAAEYATFEALKARSSVAWEEAKEKNDFSIFAPKLDQVIRTVKKFVAYRNKSVHPYEVLIDDYEKGLTIEKADAFFDNLRKEIVPVVKAISESPTVINQDFIKKSFPVEKQKQFSEYIMEQIGFRMDSGILAESVHPFTMNLFRDDVRITTRYMEHDMISTIASTIHETGHAIYEQNVSKDYGHSIIATGTSMGIHESQSRLYENKYGRSYPFWDMYYG